MYRPHCMVSNTYMAKANPPSILYHYWLLDRGRIFLGTALDDLAIYAALDKDPDRIIVRMSV